MSENIVKNLPSGFMYEPIERLDLNIYVNSGKMSAENKIMKSHIFKNKTGFTITMESSFISFNSLNYSSYNEFITIVKKVIPLLQIGNEELKRLGLRYLNHIKIYPGDPYQWEGIIIPELTRIKDFVGKDEYKYLIRNMGDMWFKKSENELDFSLHFIYGWANSEYPNPIAKKEFVLDYDCFTENGLKVNESLEYIDIFHSEIKKMFGKSIGDELKKKIGKELYE